MTDRPALFACEAPPRTKITNYPEPFAARVGGRLKRPRRPLRPAQFRSKLDPPGAGRRFFFASSTLAAG
jgi:hypothetical protein